MLNLLLLLAALANPPYPAGVEVHTSECASGGFDYFFFDDGSVIAKCWGCEATPHVQMGKWRRAGENVRVEMDREWLGVGRGPIVEVASVNVYESYAAALRFGAVRSERETFEPSDFSLEPRDTCEFARRHDRPKDPRAFLRSFDGLHPETFRRVLEEADLRGRSTDELRLMRNEIYARYGLRFRDAELAAFFAKQPGYWPHMSDVDAFLSPVERENVARLAAAEKSASAEAPAR